MTITLAVEGPTDGIVAERLLTHVGLETGVIYTTNGKGKLLRNLPGYNNAARLSPWFVLCDLDRETCAPQFIQKHLPAPSARMRFRIAVRETETWLLADVERIAHFLGISPENIPPSPEEILDPKEALVSLARKSRNRSIREDMVPAERAMRKVGPGYEARIIEFVGTHWRPDAAKSRSKSLAHCIKALQTLAG